MAYFWEKMNISSETMSAIFIVAFVSLFILAGFIIGFSLPLYILTMVLVGVIAFLYPRSGLYAIIFLTFVFERFFTLQPIVLGRVEYKLYPLDVIFGAVLIGTLFYLLTREIKRGSTSRDQNNRKRLNLLRVDYWLIAFIILTIIYFLASVFVRGNDFALAFSSMKNYAFYSLFYFVVIFLVDKKEHLFRLLKFALAGAIGIIFFIFYGLITGAGLWSEFTPLSTEGIRTLAFTHALYLSLVLVFSIVYILIQKNNLSRVLTYLIPIWVIGIVGSMMRHLWISIFVALIAVYFLIQRNYKLEARKYIYKYGVIIIAVLVILFYAFSLFPNSDLNKSVEGVSGILESRLSSIADTSDESISWRSFVWNASLGAYIDNPLTGLGLGERIYVEIEKYKDFIEVRNIHNSFLALFVQMGIWGIGLLTVLVLGIFKKAVKINFKDKNLSFIKFASIGALVMYSVAFLFQPYLETNLLGIFFWINLGIMRKLYENFGDK